MSDDQSKPWKWDPRSWASESDTPPLPEVERVAVAKVGPNDVVVIEADQPISEAPAAKIRAYAETVWPNNQVLVLGDGLRLRVLKATDL